METQTWIRRHGSSRGSEDIDIDLAEGPETCIL